MKPQQKLQCAITLLAVHFIYSTHSMAVKSELKPTTDIPTDTMDKLCQFSHEVTKNEETTLHPVNDKHDDEPKALPVQQTTTTLKTTTEVENNEDINTTTMANVNEETTILDTSDSTSSTSTSTTTTTTTPAPTTAKITLDSLKKTEEELIEKIAEVEAEPLIFSARV